MQEGQQKVITRFAPSPTGLLHLGTFRTAIFAYLYARKNGGRFILRIEDTDKARNKKEYEDNIIESLKWLGLDYDEMYRQSDNLDRHRHFLNKMIDEGRAYVSKEEAKDGSGVVKEIVRFRNPNEPVSFCDEIKGLVTMDTTDLGDFVIAKSVNEPLFHLAVVIDDFEEGVTHVIRGEDHVSNTPRQVLLQRAIGAPTPIYAHLPLVLGPDKLKLSKRRGALPVLEYKERGYLADAILNGVTFVGWNPGTEQEIFTRSELIEAFDLSKVQKSPAVFSEEKLDWFNKEHIKLLPPEEQRSRIVRAVLDEYGKTPRVDRESLICPEKLRKGVDVTYQDIVRHLETIVEKLQDVNKVDWSDENIKNALWDYATEHGRGIVLWAMRYALSGREKSPDPFTIADIIGKAETIERLKNASKL